LGDLALKPPRNVIFNSHDRLKRAVGLLTNGNGQALQHSFSAHDSCIVQTQRKEASSSGHNPGDKQTNRHDCLRRAQPLECQHH
jgi:hypothetical protein